MTNLTDAVNALPVINSFREGDIFLRRSTVLALVKDKVAVPDTGTYIVTDGVVHEATSFSHFTMRDGTQNHTVKYTIEPPKPTFFEAGKTYIYGTPIHGVGTTFKVTAIEKDSDNTPVAIGIVDYENLDPEQWVVRRHFSGWKEVE